MALVYTMNQIPFSALSDHACEALSGGLRISVETPVSGEPVIVLTPKSPPQNVYYGGPLDYTSPTFPGTSGIDKRNAVFGLV